MRDYKFFCFNGKVECFKVDYDRFVLHRANYYDSACKLLPFGEEICPPNYNNRMIFPSNLNKMMSLAEELSKDMPFLRVDFYNVKGHIYFGEITFFPASGWGKFISHEWDLKLGNMIKI